MNAITKGGYQDVPMSRRRAQLLAEYAERLATMLENAPDDKDLAEWVQSKIDRAASSIQSAYHYLDQEDDLEKGAGHKYTHRKRVGTDKRGRARYRYYYQEHHGGGITRAKLEAGSAFKLTFRGRRGHFHVESVQGDIVTVKHDGRPNSKPVQMSKAEFRALIKRQHGQALASHTEKLRRQVDKLKRNPTRKRSSLGLALHRLRQAAEKAGVTLPEEYQRKPKKKTAREAVQGQDNFDTMPEVIQGDISPSDIATYKRISAGGKSALAGMSDRDLERLHTRLKNVRRAYNTARSKVYEEVYREIGLSEAQERFAHAELLWDHQKTIHGSEDEPRDGATYTEMQDFARAEREFREAREELKRVGDKIRDDEIEPRITSRYTLPDQILAEPRGAQRDPLSVLDIEIDRRRVERQRVQEEEENRIETQRRTDEERAEAKKKARDVRQMFSEARKITNIVEEGRTGDPYRKISAPRYKAETRLERYQNVRDNIRNVEDVEEHEHALSQIKRLVDTDQLTVEQGYMLRRLLRALNPLDKTPEQLEEEEAQEYENLRYVSDVFMDFIEDRQPTPTPPREQAPEPDPSPARQALTETAEEIMSPSTSALNIDQANAQDTLTENRTRNPESKAADKALIESARELAKTSERGDEIRAAVLDLMNAQQLKRYKRATGETGLRAEDMIEKRRAARERLRGATSGATVQGEDRFDTMPEVESKGTVRARTNKALRTLKTGARADKLTKTGRRARASINADKTTIETVQKILDEMYEGMERPLPSDINQRTPQQDNYAKLRGALNGFKSAQTLTRGSSVNDHESLKQKRIKARSEIEDALKDLEARSLKELQTQTQANIEDLPPEGQRTAEDAKRFFGEPRINEATKRVTYERDGHIVTGPASGRGKGKFRYDLSLPRERFRDEPLLSGSLSSNEIGTYDTLDEALTAAINQYKPSDQMIDEMIESQREQREVIARRMGQPTPTTAREQLTETAREVESVENLRAEFKRKIEANEGDYRLYVKLFNVANYSDTLANVPDSEIFEHPITQELFSLTVAYPNDPVYIRLALQELPKEYTKRLYTELLRRYKETGQSSISEGASVGILQAHKHHFEQSTAPTTPPPIEEKEHPLLGLKTLDLEPQQVRSSYRNISHTAGKRAESERREWAETLDQLEAQAESEIQAGAKREEVEKRYQKLARRLLRTKQNVISARAQTASSAITGAGQFNARRAQKRQQVLESREAQYRQALQEIKDTQPPTPTTAREQLTETAREVVQGADNFETMPDTEFLDHPQVKAILDSAERIDAIRAINQADDAVLTRLQVIMRERRQAARKEGGRLRTVFSGPVDLAIKQSLKNRREQPEREKAQTEREQAIASLDQPLELAGIKPSDLSLEDAISSYRGTSWDFERRGQDDLLDFQRDLKNLERRGFEYIEQGASRSEVAYVISVGAQKMLEARRALNAARARTMSTMITGRGNFPVRSQRKRMDTYDKRLGDYVQAGERALKQLKKLDPKRPQPIIQGSGESAYKEKLLKLEALQEEYKRKRAEARKQGLRADDVVPRYLLTNNNAQIRRVREQIKTEQERQAELDSVEGFEDFTLPDGMELQVERDQSDNRLRLHLSDKPSQEVREKLKRNGYKWSRLNSAWQRQLTQNALSALPRTLAELGAKKEGAEEPPPPEVKAPRPSRLPEETQAAFTHLEKLLSTLEEMETQRTATGRIKGWYDVKMYRNEFAGYLNMLMRDHGNEVTTRLLEANDSFSSGRLFIRKPPKSTATEEEVGSAHGERRALLNFVRDTFEKYAGADSTQKSALHLTNYRADLYRTIERLAS